MFVVLFVDVVVLVVGGVVSFIMVGTYTTSVRAPGRVPCRLSSIQNHGAFC